MGVQSHSFSATIGPAPNSRWPAGIWKACISRPSRTARGPQPELCYGPRPAYRGGCMLGRIALFELRYQLRRPIALVSFIVFAALAVGLQSVIALAGGALFVNAPSVIAQQVGIFSIVAMFLSLAVLADVALRDAATRMDPIMR